MALAGARSRRERSGGEEIELVFDDNRLASALFGEFDQNLALIERKLGLEAVALSLIHI